MKNTITLVSLLGILIGTSCQKPCTTTTAVPGYRGDTTYVERQYANCSDTLNYYEWKRREDSTIVLEGRVVNGKRDGEWIHRGFWDNRTETYRMGTVVATKYFRNDGTLEQEEILNADSLFEVRSYHRNGSVESQLFMTMDGFMTGHGIDYDTLGRKSSEGEYIPEPCMTDTMYVESPDPPYDLQLTIVEELGGKHGPWVNYDGEGNVTDTVFYDHGILIGDQ